MEAANNNNIIITNTPVISNTVAEFTIALILSVMKKITFNDNHLRNGIGEILIQLEWSYIIKRLGL